MDEEEARKSKFRVIIVGGSVAGLTLAHCLARADIDHIVLEKRAEISPQEGAFIGIWLNGGRILDQLGLYDELKSATAPIHKMHVRFPDEFVFNSLLPWDIYESRVRSETWRLAEATQSGIATTLERNVEYACIFGISEQLAGLKIGEHINSYSKGLCVITFHGRESRVFWFILVKLPQKSENPNTPRFSADDAAKFCRKFSPVRVTEHVCVGDLWATRTFASMTALEEGLLQTWHFSRFVLLGDSVHKMTPNNGQGANTSVEDAAMLASLLREALRLNLEYCNATLALDKLLAEFQSRRYNRVKGTYLRSEFGAMLGRQAL
ncbi:hypothetical protein AN8378.2 [Aspergillus nidulans FGSC A4]|uniref:FAD-binding domain-containing protein n=1 Tax=Emericella nidulans (strain FGSC A4 / ATCC 38163 / CBS 112.46 / NRRL 194 / M139) TaxID=227321 RepID=Q5ATK2_EMENI|nr:hypothetical protein [Aspergillus nidulans FGSC A4]EAA66898.1 hypothetical protein AN8378.2 [Aspergillus nidulans FGSC A4]CBF80419.1 TPA: conserved hypothetical protein [Aspergillus nidulans FGSC A4]|eukprot:XP_681647.1 hypothetical protein AN8378.2 [Aspergillus nidulans FGSC A4]